MHAITLTYEDYCTYAHEASSVKIASQPTADACSELSAEPCSEHIDIFYAVLADKKISHQQLSTESALRHPFTIDNQRIIALFALSQLSDGNKIFLQVIDGPQWILAPSQEIESECLRVLARALKPMAPQALFMRLRVQHRHPGFKLVSAEETTASQAYELKAGVSSANIQLKGQYRDVVLRPVAYAAKNKIPAILPGFGNSSKMPRMSRNSSQSHPSSEPSTSQLSALHAATVGQQVVNHQVHVQDGAQLYRVPLQRERDRRAFSARTASQDFRSDLQPVILGGDIAAYSYARMFHEAYNLNSIVVNLACISSISASKIISFQSLCASDPEELLTFLCSLAKGAPQKKFVVVPTTDPFVLTLDEIRDKLPSQIVLTIPSSRTLKRCCDKQAFAELCDKLAIKTPTTQRVLIRAKAQSSQEEVNGSTESTQVSYQPGTYHCPLAFPVIAKAATSAAYIPFFSQGFKKVYRCESEEQLCGLFDELSEAGFSGEFLVQNCIEGDDTSQMALTFFANAGQLKLFSAAQVLLEDHAPTMRGNSVAMIVRRAPQFEALVAKIVSALDYQGFGEIDLKQDVRTGEWYVLELNPRLGRNGSYVSAGGINPMELMVSELIDKNQADKNHVNQSQSAVLIADKPCLYTLIPLSLLMRYIADPQLRDEIRHLVANGQLYNPQRYTRDRSPKRQLSIELTERNHFRKFARYYPRLTRDSF